LNFKGQLSIDPRHGHKKTAPKPPTTIQSLEVAAVADAAQVRSVSLCCGRRSDQCEHGKNDGHHGGGLAATTRRVARRLHQKKLLAGHHNLGLAASDVLAIS
jgi:hypothetical protein